MNSDPVHRAKHHQLWIDKVRTDLDQWSPPADIELCLKIDTLILLRGGTSAALDLVRTISPQRLRNELVTNDLTDHLHDAALRAIRAHGYPQRELTETDMPACSAKLHGAVNWCTYEILRCPQTQVMLLDDRTARCGRFKQRPDHRSRIAAPAPQSLPHRILQADRNRRRHQAWRAGARRRVQVAWRCRCACGRCLLLPRLLAACASEWSATADEPWVLVRRLHVRDDGQCRTNSNGARV